MSTREPEFSVGQTGVHVVDSPDDVFGENVEEFAGLEVEIQSVEWIRQRGIWAYEVLVEGTEACFAETDLVAS